MLSKTIEDALNKQVTVEAASSQVYLAMASWAETLGFEGVATFMYAHSDEEREHMLKLVKFINERGGHAKVSHLNAPPAEFGSFKEMFQNLFISYWDLLFNREIEFVGGGAPVISQEIAIIFFCLLFLFL